SSLSHAASEKIERPGSRRSPLTLSILGAVAGAILAAIAIVSARGGSAGGHDTGDQNRAAPSATPALPDPARAPSLAPPRAAPGLARLQILSQPSGASVVRVSDGASLGVTPLSVDRTAAPGDETYTVSAP